MMNRVSQHICNCCQQVVKSDKLYFKEFLLSDSAFPMVFRIEILVV